MVRELARFASKGIHTIPAWNDFNAMTSDKTVPVATIRQLPFIYAPSKDLSSIHDLAEVGGYSREAGAASHSRHRRLGHIPEGTANTVKQARVPSRESDNATWWHSLCELPTLPKMLSRQGCPVCICVRINCCQCNTSTHWSGEIVKLVTNTGVVMMSHLFATQEEADTRLVLHDIDLTTTHTRVVVRCDDTDILVLLLYYYYRGLLSDEVYMHASHAWKIGIHFHPHNHWRAWQKGMCMSPCCPCITGWNTTSAFFKISKRTAFKKLVEHIYSVQQLSEFGGSSSLSISLDTASR